MILATDVHYHDKGATAAGVLFPHWEEGAAQQTFTVEIETVLPYVSGQFYQRELPCLLALIDKVVEQIDKPLTCIVVDGFVYLDEHQRAGLGHYLYTALAGKVAVVGVAKSAFRDSPVDTQVLRGKSCKPLYVTSVGIDLADAKYFVSSMAGDFRLPTLLKQVDSLCRQKN